MKPISPTILCLGLMLHGLATLAQTTLSGSVRTIDQKPLPFVSLALLNALDSSLVKGAISNQTGLYAFENVRPGQYRLAASAVGYAPARSAIVEVATGLVTLPAMTLHESTKTLSEVTVAAKKPMYEQQVDRLVVNVQNSITAAGGTALEVLERSPGITVNRQNNSLTMSGKGGVLVMMNGKLTRLPIATVVQMLEGMAANDIEKIELITTPPRPLRCRRRCGDHQYHHEEKYKLRHEWQRLGHARLRLVWPPGGDAQPQPPHAETEPLR